MERKLHRLPPCAAGIAMDHALNPTFHRLRQLCRMDRVWVRGTGAWLTDDRGRRFLDCSAQYGAVGLGHNAPCVIAAVRAALDDAEPAMVQPYRAPHAVALAEELSRLLPGGRTRCVFTTSGAEAVEAAIKLVRSRTGRPIILSAEGSFHGKTLGALAVTGQTQFAEGFGPLPPGFERIPFGDAPALAQRLARDGDRIAAVFLEPIQGERGVHLPPPGYLSQVRELCTRHRVALVLDEIQTGLGRTGRLFACEHDGVIPDVLLLAKALGGGLFPLGACLIADAWWDERFGLRHSSTFANNNIACRVGRAVLEAVSAEGFREAVAERGERLLTGLKRLAERYPRVIAAVRGRGLLAAIELTPPSHDGDSFLSFLGYHGLHGYAVAAVLAEQAGVLVLPTLGAAPVLRVTPPLVISFSELDLALDGLESVCARLDRNPVETIVRGLGALEESAPGADIEFDRRPPVLPSPIVAEPTQAGRYAFLIHPTGLEDIVLANPGLRRLSAAELGRFRDYISQFPPSLVLRAPLVRSATGCTAEGFIITVPLMPEEMVRRGLRLMCQEIAKAVDLASSLGAQVVGLGGFTTPFSRRGLAVVGRGPAITTGNALTAAMAFASLARLTERLQRPLAGSAVAVVGAAGSVGGLCARLLARSRPRRLLLVGNPDKGHGRLQRLCEELTWEPGSVEVTTDLGRLAGCDVVVSATGAVKPVLDGASLAAGTIIYDLARPADVSPRVRQRPDLTVIDGGLVVLPDPSLRFGPGNIQSFPNGIQLGCLSETILLALEGTTRDHGVGDDVSLTEADEVMALAERHGFHPAPLPAESLGRAA